MSYRDLNDYTLMADNALMAAKAECEIITPSVMQRVESDIVRTEQRLTELKELRILLEDNPQFEKMLSLLKRY